MLNTLLVIALLGALMFITHKLPLSPEASRKTIHLGMGIICLSFPFLFTSPTQVDLLATLAVTTLLLIRWLKPAIGNTLHQVQRLSFGELLFPVGVAIVFRLSNNDPSTYLTSIAVLTFADTAGALIGKRFGKHPYRTNAGQKSLEGSLAVFLVTFLIILLSGISSDLLTNVLLSIAIALAITMAEGILGAGIDNLIIPITTLALIFFFRDLTWPDLLARIFILTALGAFLFTIRKLTSLNGGGLLSATIFAYLCFVLGGPKYLLAPTLLFFIHLLTTWRYPKLAIMEHSADSISAIALPGLIWITIKTSAQFPPEICYHGFTLTIIAQAAFLHSATRAHLDLPTGLLIAILKISLIAITVITWWFTPIATLILIIALPLTRNFKRPEQAIIAFLFSLLAFLS